MSARVRAATRLRQLLAGGPTLFVPGCDNALTARILSRPASPPSRDATT